MKRYRPCYSAIMGAVLLGVSAIASANIPLPSALACSQQNPCASVVGNWLTIDDNTKQPRGVVRLYRHTHDGKSTIQGVSRFGFYTPGREWSETYNGPYQPYQGRKNGTFLIMYGYENQGHGRWPNGRVIDIDGGRSYKSHLQLEDHGNTLKVSGCIASFLCRSQQWIRLTDAQYQRYQALSKSQEKIHPKGP